MKVRHFYGLGGRARVRYCGEADVYNTETPVEKLSDEEGDWWEFIGHDDQAESYSIVHYELDTTNRVGVSIWDIVGELVDGASLTDYFRVPEDASYDVEKNLLCVQFMTDESLYIPESDPDTRLDTSGQICVRRCDGKPMSAAARKAFWTAVWKKIASERPSFVPDEVNPQQIQVAAKEKRVRAKARVHTGWEFDGFAGRTAFPRCAPRFMP